MATSYCYPTHLRCIYNVYKSHAIGCPNSEHLKACEHYQCPRMFKCLTTYCIPTYLLCDGVHHCPNGEDEQSCDRFTCTGLLRCRYDNVCVHPSDICDGHEHCLMSGDDERFCNVTLCPTKCTCHGSAIRCQGRFPSTLISASYFRYAMLRDIYIHSKFQLQSFNALSQLHILDSLFDGNRLTDKMFHHLTALQILVLCRNSIEFIESGIFMGLVNLQHIDLTGNLIKRIKTLNFLGLQLISILDLSKQMISQVEDFSFFGLSSLQHLNLSSNAIKTLPSRCFGTLAHAKLINLTNNSLLHLSRITFSDLQPQVTIMFSNSIYCCYLSKVTPCLSNTTLHQHRRNCQTMVENFTIQLILLITSAAILIMNIVLALSQQSKITSSHNMLTNYLTILNLFSSIYILALSIIYIHYYGDHIYFGTTFPSSPTCLCLQIIAMSGVLLLPYTRLLLTVNRLLVTRYVFTRRPLSARQVAFYTILGWCVSLTIVLWGNFTSSRAHFSCFPMLLVYGESDTLRKRIDIWIYGTLATVILVAIFSIYVSILRFVKHQDKKFGRKTKKRLIINAVITLMIDFLMYVFFGAIVILYYSNVNSFHIFIIVCIVMLCHSCSPLLYEIHKLCRWIIYQ